MCVGCGCCRENNTPRIRHRVYPTDYAPGLQGDMCRATQNQLNSVFVFRRSASDFTSWRYGYSAFNQAQPMRPVGCANTQLDDCLNELQAELVSTSNLNSLDSSDIRSPTRQTERPGATECVRPQRPVTKRRYSLRSSGLSVSASSSSCRLSCDFAYNHAAAPVAPKTTHNA